MTLAIADLQHALDFLKRLPRLELETEEIPAQIDYASIAALANAHGVHLHPEAVAEAFRLLIRARMIAARSPG